MLRFVSACLLAASVCAGQLPRFQAITAVDNLKMGYQLVAVDLNGDGRKDLVVVDERSTELAWFENPGWERHVLANDVPRVINLDCTDLDGDRIPEIAMAHHFESSPAKSIGAVLLLKSGTDPRAPWTKKKIDRVPTAHRLRWIRVDPKASPLLLVAPLVGPEGGAPDYGGKTPIFAYRPGAWQRTTISNDLNGVLHSIAPVDWTTMLPQQLLTASFDGIDLLEPRKSGLWKKTHIGKGDPRPCPQCGSSEIKMGRLGRERFLASIEPWHGNQVVVYRSGKNGWSRHVLDDTMVNGHALAVGDLDGDENDEIVAGFRGKGFRLTVFRWKGDRWQPHVIDEGGVAAADCKIEDLNGDGRADIVCSGASTGNVKIYQNLGAP